MWSLFETAVDLKQDAEVLRRRSYGVIEMEDERLVGIHLRPWPRMISVAEAKWLGARFHRDAPGNRCKLYYNQPWGFRNFLTLKYVVSSRDATLRTFRGALLILDEIARIKQSDAALCEACNLRISDRLLNRWGWRRHVPDSDRRHFIKRFYGEYPAPHEAWALCQGGSRANEDGGEFPASNPAAAPLVPESGETTPQFDAAHSSGGTC